MDETRQSTEGTTGAGNRWQAFLDACFERSWFSKLSLGLAFLSLLLVLTGLWLCYGIMTERSTYLPLLHVGVCLPFSALVLGTRALLEPEPRHRLTIVGLVLNGLLAVTWLMLF